MDERKKHTLFLEIKYTSYDESALGIEEIIQDIIRDTLENIPIVKDFLVDKIRK